MGRHNMIYKPGDKVVVRKWDDMVAEYGVDNNGNIPVYCSFVPEMKKYCGEVLTIKDVRKNSYKVWETGWSWSDGMFEAPKNSIRYYLNKNKKIYKGE